jgi:probable rRNA maturation factor
MEPSLSLQLLNRQTLYRLPLSQFKQLALFVITNEKDLYALRCNSTFPLKKYEFTISFLDEKKMVVLHQQTHGLSVPTDVLSYGYLEPGKKMMDPVLGEVFVSVEQAKKNYRSFHSGLEEEMLLYLVHGILHCFGYDDTSAASRKAMRRRERFYMDVFTALKKGLKCRR